MKRLCVGHLFVIDRSFFLFIYIYIYVLSRRESFCLRCMPVGSDISAFMRTQKSTSHKEKASSDNLYHLF